MILLRCIESVQHKEIWGPPQSDGPEMGKVPAIL